MKVSITPCRIHACSEYHFEAFYNDSYQYKSRKRQDGLPGKKRLLAKSDARYATTCLWPKPRITLEERNITIERAAYIQGTSLSSEKQSISDCIDRLPDDGPTTTRNRQTRTKRNPTYMDLYERLSANVRWGFSGSTLLRAVKDIGFAHHDRIRKAESPFHPGPFGNLTNTCTKYISKILLDKLCTEFLVTVDVQVAMKPYSNSSSKLIMASVHTFEMSIVPEHALC